MFGHKGHKENKNELPPPKLSPIMTSIPIANINNEPSPTIDKTKNRYKIEYDEDDLLGGTTRKIEYIDEHRLDLALNKFMQQKTRKCSIKSVETVSFAKLD